MKNAKLRSDLYVQDYNIQNQDKIFFMPKSESFDSESNVFWLQSEKDP